MNIKEQVLRIYPAFGGRNYCLHFWGQLISSSGTWLQNVAMGWYAWELTHSASLTALILALPRCTSACLTIFGGIVSDKYDKRKVLYATNFLSMLQAISLGYLAIHGSAHIWIVIVLSVCLGLINAVDGPARHSFLPEIVRREEIKQTSAFNSAMGQSAQFIGSSIAGLLLGLVGAGWTFILNGLTFLAVIFMLWMMKISRTAIEEKDSENSLRMLGKGAAYIFSQPKICLCLTLILCLNFFGFSYRGILPAIAEQIFYSGEKGYAVFMAFAGLGAVLGSLLASAKSKIPFHFFVISGSMIVGSSLILFSMTSVLMAGIAFMFTAGFGLTLSSSIVRGECQEAMNDDMRGRVNGFVMACAVGGTGLGGAAAGELAQLFGCELALIANGVALLIIALVVFCLRKKL